MAVMTGTGGTAKWRVTCTGTVCHAWSSQPGGGFGGSESDGPGGDLAAGEPGAEGVAGADGDADADGDTDDAGDAGGAGDDDR
jgi:hypothetical protein